MAFVRHIGITVSDLDKSLEFYRDYLGFKVEKQMVESGECIDRFSALEGVSVTTVKMSGTEPTGMIELLYYHSHNDDSPQSADYPITRVGCSHFALTISDLDSLYENLINAGIRFNYPVQISPDGNVKIAFCRDPDGNLIELVEEL
jgi:glyoxylase I family protein